MVLLWEMDNRDQRGTQAQTQQGHDGDHGVHACRNCGQPFPVRHSSSKQRRVNNSSRGTVEGSNPLDDDPHSQGRNSLDTENQHKENHGVKEDLTRSYDELFLDAIANFSDSAPMSGSMELLQDSFYSATDVEIDVNQLIVKSTDDGQMQDPSILQGKSVQEGNMLELQAQRPYSQMESARGIQFATSDDVKTSQEIGEGNVKVLIDSVCDNRADDEAFPQNECEDFKDHERLTPQNSLSIPSRDPLKTNSKDSDSDVDNHVLFNQSQLNEKREVLPPDEPVPDCTMEWLESWELVDEASIESSFGTLMIESDEPDEIGGGWYGLKFNIDWDYIGGFSKERGSDDARESSQHITETTVGISSDNNECADKSPLSGAEEDNEMNRSCRVNKECDISTSSDNVSGNTDVPPSSVTQICIGDDINCGNLEGGYVSGLPSNLKGLYQQHSSSSSSQAGGFLTLTPSQGTNKSQGEITVEEIIAEMRDSIISQPHWPVQSLLSESAYSSNESESSADEAAAGEGGNDSNSPADINSENKKVKRRLHWSSYICCCFGVD